VKLAQLYNTLLETAPQFANKCVVAVEELEWMTSKYVNANTQIFNNYN
jgi:hypothetical protein